MRVDVWSDLVCPWSYVGKRRFETALEQFDHRADVQVVHRSFQLNPAAPRDRTSERRERLMWKKRLFPPQVEEIGAGSRQVAAAGRGVCHLRGTVSPNT